MKAYFIAILLLLCPGVGDYWANSSGLDHPLLAAVEPVVGTTEGIPATGKDEFPAALDERPLIQFFHGLNQELVQFAELALLHSTDPRVLALADRIRRDQIFADRLLNREAAEAGLELSVLLANPPALGWNTALNTLTKMPGGEFNAAYVLVLHKQYEAILELMEQNSRGLRGSSVLRRWILRVMPILRQHLSVDVMAQALEVV